MEIKDIAMSVGKALDNKKAEDLKIIDIGAKSSFADFLILASGNSERQISALADEVEEEMAKAGIELKSIEGKKESGWILMDYGDNVISLFTREMREKYNIEKVWADCNVLPLSI